MIFRPVTPESPMGPPTTKRPGGVDEELGLLVEQLLGQGLDDDVLADGLVDLLVGDLIRVLRGHHHRVDAHRAAVHVLAR